jgi:hypothetical protein
MVCRVCGRRPARRACPALTLNICSLCCGTKREVEIRCPADCGYLFSGRAHPAVSVRRQQEDDARVFFPSARDLNETQADILLAVLGFLRDYRGDGFLRVTDDDVENAASALAATHETAARGVIYEQRPQSLAAQRLVNDLRPFIAPLGRDRGTSFDGDLAAVFRAIERGAREARQSLEGGDTAYLAMVRRLVVPQADAGPGARPGSSAAGSRLVV